MNTATLRLALTKTLKVYSGEGGRTAAFAILHILISIVIGMTSTTVDAITVGRSDDGGAYFLYGISAILLALIGFGYAGVTDRTDKRRVLTRALILSAGISVAAALLMVGADTRRTSETIVQVLFMWRFLVGIVLLMVFWDLTPFYFNARQGKRLFPLLAMSGAVGYAVGSLVAASAAQVIPAWVIILVIGAMTLAAVVWFHAIRSRFSILDSPRYRERSIIAEVREGFTAFWSNRFLRAVGWNTILFGILSGLIIFTYNAVVTARTAGTTETAEVLGIQRAVVTILQATVLTKVLSQSAVGGKNRASIIQQGFFLLIGTAAFIVSMVGVADFTRQIEVALMSPAAMAAFAFLPAKFRGRVMVLNNLVAAAVGILIATIAVAATAPYVEPLWFVYPIGALMVARIGVGVFLNRRYTDLLSERIVGSRQLNLSRLDEDTGSIIQDDALLERLRREVARQSDSVRTFVLSRLARAAQSRGDVERIAPFFEDTSAELTGLWIETLGRVAFDEYRDRIESAADAAEATVRIAARLAIFAAFTRRNRFDELEERITTLHRDLHTETVQRGDRFGEYVELAVRTERIVQRRIIDLEWSELSEEQRDGYLDVMIAFPNVERFSLLQQLLDDERYAVRAVAAIAALPPEFILEHRSAIADAPRATRRELVRAATDPVLVREESVSLLNELLADLTAENAFERIVRDGEAIIETALAVLSDPSPLGSAIAKSSRQGRDLFAALLPPLFQIRFAAHSVTRRERPLAEKITREYLHRTAVIVLLLTSMNLTKEEDRVVAATVCRELAERATIVQHNTLEFIETKLTGDTQTYVSTLYEKMTVTEKRNRLHSMLRRSTSSIHDIVASYRRTLEQLGEDLPAELIGTVASQ